MTEIKRIVVFTGSFAQPVRKGIVAIDRVLPDLQWLVLNHLPRKSLGQIVRAQWKNLRREGWRRIPAVASSARERLFSPSPGAVPPSAPGRNYSLEALSANPRMRILDVADLNADATLSIVQEFAPDLGLSLAAPILRTALFSIPRLGTINLHKGKVPNYRGMPPAFWELWNNETSVGCTIHAVEKQLDTGPVLASSSVHRDRYSTVRGLQLQLDEIGIELMRDVVCDLARGTAKPVPQEPGGTTFRRPTLAQEGELERRLAREAPADPPFLKRLAKEAVRGSTYQLVRRALSRFSAPRATILLYHRVTDSVRDDLTVGVAQFERQMSLLRQNFELVSLRDLLQSGSIPRTGRPLVGVTFDDGYLDNFTHAAPILERHEIPATFFVSTGIVGTDRRFPHDIRRGNPPIPLMQWDQIRALSSAGFDIGSHTVNHIDCAAESDEVVWQELEQSRDDLRRELGIQEIIFSYPYGGRQHMTPARLELVKKAGYVACVSAYGGSNVGSIDRFNILRCGCHYEFSDRAFLWESVGHW